VTRHQRESGTSRLTITLSDARYKALKEAAAAGGAGDHDTVAAAKAEHRPRVACFLASDAASYLTGQTLNVNGGICMG
jgi:3-oxoacyl-[acyl-carrier protein] reductase